MDEKPPSGKKKSFNIVRLPKLGRKKIVLGPLERRLDPPKGLRVREKFERIGMLNPTVIQDKTNPNKLTLFPRLSYYDGEVEYSCIVKREAYLDGTNVRLSPDEEVIFQAGSFYDARGVEDLRAARVNGEKVFHGFPVCFDGFNARIMYVRTFESSPMDFSKWQTQFGYYFPNILAKKAIELVGVKRYEQAWETAYGEQTIIDARAAGRKDLPDEIFLSTKDCCSFPEKVEKDFGKGKSKYYAIAIRFLPDMQVVYVKSFEDLAKNGFWEGVVGNLEGHVMMQREFDWEESHIGLGAAPVLLTNRFKNQQLNKKFKGLYLISYHGVSMNGGRNYRGGEATVDKADPQKVFERTKESVLFATEEWEENGVVPGKIVFPTAYIFNDGLIHCFYGAGDKFVGHIAKQEKDILKPFH